MMRILLAAVLGGIVLYGWGMVSWMVLPFHGEAIDSLSNESATMAWLGEQVPGSGLYMFPAMPATMSGEPWQTYKQRHEAGPVGMLILTKGGPVMPPAVMATGFGINCLTALLAACLLAAAGLKHYVSRLIFMVALGLLIGVTADGLYWNWMLMPMDHTLAMGADRVIGLALAGLVLAAIVRPRREPREQAAEAA